MTEPNRAVGLWLLSLAGMIVVMTLLGGVTRLTDSGLSIMEWNPLLGALPPTSQAEWERLFALYRQIAEYKQVNPGMTLAAFRSIFWWEYLHRFWGRLIGLAFLLPFLYFLWRGAIGRRDAWRYLLIFALGALQGLAGWFMVASGFQDRIDVSQYRLAVHLLLAVLLFAAIFWLALDHLDARPTHAAEPARRSLRRHGHWLLALVALEIGLGGLVAGTDAGFVYNDFPLMNGHLLPPDLLHLSPWWRNAGENPAMVQLQHRIVALILLIVLATFVQRARRAAQAGALALALRGRFHLLAVASALQAGLGVATLMLVVPLPLAVLHQLGAFLLLASLLFVQHGLARALH